MRTEDSSQRGIRKFRKTIRAADAKEVGVGNPAEETYRYPNQNHLQCNWIPGLVNPRRKVRDLADLLVDTRRTHEIGDVPN